jgi:cell division septation protein DedD
MKTIQASDFDSSTKIDKELESWTLSWRPEGRCDSFTREAILACAPATSGVYGLFNFDCQLFIGESENIQEVLLRLERESDFQSEQLRPTGFTFESCAPELRKAKAAELIARFRPVLQTEAALTEIRALANGPMLTAARGARQKSETDADDHEFPLHSEQRSKVHWSFKLKRGRVVALATVLIASAAGIYIFRSADSQKRVNGAGEKPPSRTAIAQPPVSRQVGSKRQTVAANDTARKRTHEGSEATPAKAAVHANVSTPDGVVRLATTKASSQDEVNVQKLTGPTNTIPASHPAGGANSGKKWSVQISAAPAKDIADSLAQRLIAKGYNGFVAQAEVKGQTYYRVRVGPFGAREEAESARQSLARQEDYHDAYLTAD